MLKIVTIMNYKIWLFENNVVYFRLGDKMKKRIISAIVALIIVVPLIILGGKPYIIGVGILSVLALKELIDLKKHHKNIQT